MQQLVVIEIPGLTKAMVEQSAPRLQALAKAVLSHRLVLTLFCIEGLDHESIAEILGCPVGTVWSRLFHARAALARQLGMETE